MKIAILLVVAAIAAFLYFKPSSAVVEAPRPAPPVAVAPQRNIIVAPVTDTKVADRWKTGPNAQSGLTPKIDRLTTGPNAQAELTLRIDRLKIGPDAQTDLSPKIDRLKTGPNAQSDLTLKRSW